MRSARSPPLLLLGIAFALWSPLLSVPGSSKRDCRTVPDKVHWCGMSKERFFYNVTSKTCQSFDNYGCNGKLNSHRTLKECLQFCSETDFCQLPPEKGPCDDKLERWFYDPKNEDCRTFTFGGCKGNLNNFIGPWSCRLICQNRGTP